MSNSDQEQRSASRPGLYQEITDKIIQQIEAGIIPWVQPWASNTSLSIPRNATTQRTYSGINIVLLWDALFSRHFEVNQWLTYKQALAFGGQIRKGERGTTVVYADSFVPKKSSEVRRDTADGAERRVPFLKRFTVFNVAQCNGLPFEYSIQPKQVSQRLPIQAAEALISASGARFERGGEHAYYHIADDCIRVPDQTNFFEPINFYRTALHELTTGRERSTAWAATLQVGSAAKPTRAKSWSRKWAAPSFAPPSASCRRCAMPTMSATGLRYGEVSIWPIIARWR